MSSAYIMKIGIYSVVKAYIWNDFRRIFFNKENYINPVSILDWNIKNIFRTYFSKNKEFCMNLFAEIEFNIE